ncbi:Wadjet anti-phage system protein JetA family protein [Tumebacillus lipolyticus]|uniref:Wadjet anti-phage system protein JetA family protein n=1 Tax=Tumebacillus lipolyticus TaxID=1280370 RepID=A0ABW5A1H0_9BACL
MRLFEVVPENFFSLLSRKNKYLYAEALLLLYEEYQKNRFGIQYETMRDLLQELIETQELLGLAYEDEEEDQPSLRSQHESSTSEELSRFKANALLRRLREQEWIDVESRDQFQQYIVLPHYSSRILAVLKDLCEGKTIEYQRFTFSTYQLLAGEEASVRPCVALLEAEKMTMSLLDELRVLINNMKHHMEQVLSKETIQDVLEHHFSEYKTKVVDMSYHRLKTSDHVARYRSRILDNVQKWLLDRDRIEDTITDGLKSELYQTREEAERVIRGALLNIEEVYSGLDEMFYQIDLRHNQFLRASFERARYLGQHSHGIDQQLSNYLQWISEQIQEDTSFNVPQSLFRLIELNFISEQSLLTPRTKRAPHSPDEYVVVPLSDELRKKIREENLARLEKTITREKVQKYVFSKLGNRKQMRLEELAPSTLEEFLLLAFTYLYGYDETVGFRLERSADDRILVVGNYRFYDRQIVHSNGGE